MDCPTVTKFCHILLVLLFFIVFFQLNYLLPLDKLLSVLEQLLLTGALAVKRKTLELLAEKLRSLSVENLTEAEVKYYEDISKLCFATLNVCNIFFYKCSLSTTKNNAEILGQFDATQFPELSCLKIF